jgi:hypothetical protein
MSPVRLSKSRIMAWRQCPKRLWLEVNRPELVVYPPATQRRFDMGHQVGAVAQGLHPGGILVEPPTLGQALQDTARRLARRGDLTLFEATFSHGGVLVRADLLIRSSGACRMVEVKSATEAKPYHVADATVQTWVVRGAGVPLERVAVACVDRDFVYGGHGDYHGLFREVDVTGQVDAAVNSVPAWIDGCTRTLLADMPPMAPSNACTDPFDCPFVAFCSEGSPEYPVSLLPRGGRVAGELAAAGYADLRDVPDGWPMSDLQRRVWRATRGGHPHFDAGAAAHLADRPYPRFYLDFETVQFAVPLWAGTRPWEQLPFQWSCHVERAPGALEHREFLDTSGEAPMRSCADTLLAVLGAEGPVFVYGGFEAGVLRSLAGRFPDIERPLLAVVARLVDLLPVTREAWYHPAMKGSWSIKDVLPTVAPDLGYDDLGEVHDGTAAQYAFAEAIHPDTLPERADDIAHDLLAYCARDSLALVRLRRFLSRE